MAEFFNYFFGDWQFAVVFSLVVILGGVFLYFELLYTLKLGLGAIGIIAYIIDALRGRLPKREEEKKDNREEEKKDE